MSEQSQSLATDALINALRGDVDPRALGLEWVALVDRTTTAELTNRLRYVEGGPDLVFDVITPGTGVIGWFAAEHGGNALVLTDIPAPVSEAVPPIVPCMPWEVVAVVPLPSYRLRVEHLDGTTGIVDMSARVRAPDAGVFAALADEELFRQVFVQYGAVTWPGELDLAPDAMHDEIQAHGEWVLA
jgi:hypothetical protein